MAECRHCGDEVTWCRTPNGVMMCVQSDPDDGELVLVDEGDTHATCRRYVPRLDPTHIGRNRYTAHADFCDRDT